MRFWIAVFLTTAFLVPAQAQAGDWQFYCKDYHFKKVVWKWEESPLAVWKWEESPLASWSWDGNPSAIWREESPTKVAEAGYLLDGTPVLKVNQRILANWGADPLLGKYALNYACARLVLGHLLKPPGNVYERIRQVNNADCWAINKFYYDTRNEESLVDAIQEKINGLPREKWVHFPGPVRVVDFRGSCRFKGR